MRLDIHTVDDLLHYYPRAYNHFEEPVPVRELMPDTVAACAGMLEKTPGLARFKHMQVVTAALRDDSGAVSLTWYNMPYLKTTLKPDVPYIFRGAWCGSADASPWSSRRSTARQITGNF